MPRFRQKLQKKVSRKKFTKGALRVHPKNAQGERTVMRGGIRL